MKKTKFDEKIDMMYEIYEILDMLGFIMALILVGFGVVPRLTGMIESWTKPIVFGILLIVYYIGVHLYHRHIRHLMDIGAEDRAL